MDLTTENLTKRSELLRGQIIETMSGFEKALDIYLITYFTDNPTKQDQLLTLLFASFRVSLESKRQVFDQLLKINQPAFYLENKTFKNDMISIIENRNIIAHNELDRSPEAVLMQEQQLTYIRFNNKIVKITFTEKDIFKLKLKISHCTMRLLTLMGFDKLSD